MFRSSPRSSTIRHEYAIPICNISMHRMHGENAGVRHWSHFAVALGGGEGRTQGFGRFPGAVAGGVLLDPPALRKRSQLHDVETEGVDQLGHSRACASCPCPTASRASWDPVFPEPMKPIVVTSGPTSATSTTFPHPWQTLVPTTPASGNAARRRRRAGRPTRRTARPGRPPEEALQGRRPAWAVARRHRAVLRSKRVRR